MEGASLSLDETLLLLVQLTYWQHRFPTGLMWVGRPGPVQAGESIWTRWWSMEIQDATARALLSTVVAEVEVFSCSGPGCSLVVDRAVTAVVAETDSAAVLPWLDRAKGAELSGLPERLARLRVDFSTPAPACLAQARLVAVA